MEVRLFGKDGDDRSEKDPGSCFIQYMALLDGVGYHILGFGEGGQYSRHNMINLYTYFFFL